MVNPENICDNVCLWDGNPETWQPPLGYTMLIQDETPSKTWVLDKETNQYVLTDSIGLGSVGFTWDGTFLITSEPQPVPPVV